MRRPSLEFSKAAFVTSLSADVIAPEAAMPAEKDCIGRIQEFSTLSHGTRYFTVHYYTTTVLPDDIYSIKKIQSSISEGNLHSSVNSLSSSRLKIMVNMQKVIFGLDCYNACNM